MCAGIAVFLCLLLIKPLKGFLILGFQSALGGVGLYIINFALNFVGLTIGVNLATASVCGLLGIPGFVLLLVLKIIL